MVKRLVLAITLFVLLGLPIVVNAIDVNAILNNVATLLFTVFLWIVVLMVTWAGILYITARGDPGKIQKASLALVWAVVGVAVGLLAWSVGGLIRGILGV